MKILVDTCGWIEWLSDGQHANFFGRYLRRTENLVVPTIVQFELYKWVCREKDEVTALEVLWLSEQCLVVPLDTSAAIFAADIGRQHKLAMADAIIYATAIQNQALVITADKHFSKLANVEFPGR